MTRYPETTRQVTKKSEKGEVRNLTCKRYGESDYITVIEKIQQTIQV